MTHYVIIRDDDINALTPTEYIKTLYQPFIEKKLPINFAVIPKVNTQTRFNNDQLEGYLAAGEKSSQVMVPFSLNKDLIFYLKSSPLFHVVQHGFSHESFEFDSKNRKDLAFRIEEGMRCLLAAGFPKAQTFVAPYDKLSSVAFEELAKRFNLISTGWFEWQRIPYAWLPHYVLKKINRKKEWRVGHTLLLSHPGCLISYQRPYDQIFESVKKTIENNQLTVLVTHWWEFFREGKADAPLISILHQVKDYLSENTDIQVVSFDDLINGKVNI